MTVKELLVHQSERPAAVLSSLDSSRSGDVLHCASVFGAREGRRLRRASPTPPTPGLLGAGSGSVKDSLTLSASSACVKEESRRLRGAGGPTFARFTSGLVASSCGRSSTPLAPLTARSGYISPAAGLSMHREDDRLTHQRRALGTWTSCREPRLKGSGAFVAASSVVPGSTGGGDEGLVVMFGSPRRCRGASQPPPECGMRGAVLLDAKPSSKEQMEDRGCSSPSSPSGTPQSRAPLDWSGGPSTTCSREACDVSQARLHIGSNPGGSGASTPRTSLRWRSVRGSAVADERRSSKDRLSTPRLANTPRSSLATTPGSSVAALHSYITPAATPTSDEVTVLPPNVPLAVRPLPNGLRVSPPSPAGARSSRRKLGGDIASDGEAGGVPLERPEREKVLQRREQELEAAALKLEVAEEVERRWLEKYTEEVHERIGSLKDASAVQQRECEEGLRRLRMCLYGDLSPVNALNGYKA
eukprot:TRINITY_DN45353_c0_g1_i1.p1 TRINITY_DN45353_c0_g1~~TRINITY_DN45353_c0_g1_i1.p1  ORF type:complete len:473 (-),score=80.55 TRINITY_DN45353_c0_g1_i1:69-1487(-)